MERVGKLDASLEELAQLKKAYRAEYLKSYKKEARLLKKEYSLCFDKYEAGRIRRAAKDHELHESTFLRKIIIAYLDNAYVVRDKAMLDRIMQMLMHCEEMVRKVAQSDKGAWYKADRRYEELLLSITEIKNWIAAEFAKPPLLLDEIRKAIRENPRFIELLKEFFNGTKGT